MLKPMKMGKTLKVLNERIAAFEEQFGISSYTMRRELKADTRKETFEICQWLMVLNLKERLESK